MAGVRFVLAAIAALLGLVLLFPLMLCWAVFESVAVFVRFAARLFERKVFESNQLIEFHPTLGWKPRANLDGYYLTMVKDGVYHALTDSQGWPDKRNLAECDVVVFGDSYAFGYGVNADAAFWSHQNGIAVKSIGAPGYNMVQELLLMKQHATQLTGKLVIWFIYFGNDLYDNLMPNNQHYRAPFVRKSGAAPEWEITTGHVSSATWPSHRDPKYYDRLSELCYPSFLTERAYSACEFLIREAKSVCTQVQAQLVLMTIPDAIQLTPRGCQSLAATANHESFDADFPDKKMKEIASNFGVPLIPLKDHLSAADYKDRDPHWNEQGHQRVAQVIRQVWHEFSTQGESSPVQERKRAAIVEEPSSRSV